MAPRRPFLLGVLFSLLALGGAQAAVPCVVKRGSAETLIEARVLTPSGILRNGQVLVTADGSIGCVGAGCAAAAPAASLISCPDAVLSPGFINGHEHLDFNHIPPTPDDGVRYGHRHDWRKGLRGLPGKETFKADKEVDLLAWSELRHLLTGTTSMIGEAMAPGLVRNLDFQEGLEGLRLPRATYAIFPLDDVAGTLRDGDCDYGPRPLNEATVSALHALVAHVGEGRDAQARNEFACLTSRTFDAKPTGADGGGVSHDILYANTTVIHGVAMTAPMLQTLADRHVPMIWSPRSNLYLYGQTTNITSARKAGVTLALGTDWLPSGSVSMPREAECALAYSRDHLGGLITPRDLWRMMTVDAAKAVKADSVIGAIETGKAADLILVNPRYDDPYESVVRVMPEDLFLIMRGGKILAGALDLLPGVKELGGTLEGIVTDGPDCETVMMGNVPRRVCISEDAGNTYKALSENAAKRGVWPAAFKYGVPPVEPPCVTKP